MENKEQKLKRLQMELVEGMNQTEILIMELENIEEENYKDLKEKIKWNEWNNKKILEHVTILENELKEMKRIEEKDLFM